MSLALAKQMEERDYLCSDNWPSGGFLFPKPAKLDVLSPFPYDFYSAPSTGHSYSPPFPPRPPDLHSSAFKQHHSDELLKPFLVNSYCIVAAPHYEGLITTFLFYAVKAQLSKR